MENERTHHSGLLCFARNDDVALYSQFSTLNSQFTKMKQVLVFKTSVSSLQEMEAVEPLLNGLLHETEQWNFDLEDCDRILRIEAVFIQPPTIIDRMRRAGFSCAELGD